MPFDQPEGMPSTQGSDRKVMEVLGRVVWDRTQQGRAGHCVMAQVRVGQGRAGTYMSIRPPLYQLGWFSASEEEDHRIVVGH